MNPINVGIIGVSGYTGLELVKMLITHPIFTLTYCANTEGETTIGALHPSLVGVCDLRSIRSIWIVLQHSCELIFLALPHKTAMQTAKGLLERGIKVVDLSADYRLSAENYEAAYCEHEDLDNLSHASLFNSRTSWQYRCKGSPSYRQSGLSCYGIVDGIGSVFRSH